jgi:hypothetical protein
MTAQVVGVSLLGLLGGFVGHAVYMVLLEALSLFRVRMRRTRSVTKALGEFLSKETGDLILGGILACAFVLAVRYIPVKFNIEGGVTLRDLVRLDSDSTSVRDYLILCVGYFVWAGFGYGIRMAAELPGRCRRCSQEGCWDGSKCSYCGLRSTSPSSTPETGGADYSFAFKSGQGPASPPAPPAEGDQGQGGASGHTNGDG